MRVEISAKSDEKWQMNKPNCGGSDPWPLSFFFTKGASSDHRQYMRKFSPRSAKKCALWRLTRRSPPPQAGGEQRSWQKPSGSNVAKYILRRSNRRSIRNIYAHIYKYVGLRVSSCPRWAFYVEFSEFPIRLRYDLEPEVNDERQDSRNPTCPLETVTNKQFKLHLNIS